MNNQFNLHSSTHIFVKSDKTGKQLYDKNASHIMC